MTSPAPTNLVIHAPNVHQGGGLVLLQALLQVDALPLRQAFLDQRAQAALQLLKGARLHYVRRSMFSRLWAEWKLWCSALTGDTLLCFHGLPPLLPQKGKVVVFIQNRLLIESSSLAGYPFPTRFRLLLERLWCKFLQGRCSHYIVQTPSMAEALKRWLKKAVPVSVVPFVGETLSTSQSGLPNQTKRFDFVYIASGETHKNHLVLIEAWRLLAEGGVRPSLALTLNVRDNPDLCKYLELYSTSHELAVTNLGQLSREEIASLYGQASALIYPSTKESFGLPLIEASQLGLPILAAELDYVRDVVEPVETFDPTSSLSIARAVRRFLGDSTRPIVVGNASDFLVEVLQ